MICNFVEMLGEAKKGKYAVGAFNTPTAETLKAVIEAAEELDTPVIISHAQSFQGTVPIEWIGPQMVRYAKRAKVPVCVHLDHGLDLHYAYKAIRLGFTSVMYDCSRLPYEKNADELTKFSEIAHQMDISVEGELGEMPGIEGGTGIVRQVKDGMTKVEEAKEYVVKTGVDLLTVSIGSVHGGNKHESNVRLDIDRLKALSEVAGDCPLGMHGGSSVPDEQLVEAIANGISKINYYTAIGKAPSDAIRQKIEDAGEPVYYHEIAKLAEDIMNERCKEAIRIFTNKR